MAGEDGGGVGVVTGAPFVEEVVGGGGVAGAVVARVGGHELVSVGVAADGFSGTAVVGWVFVGKSAQSMGEAVQDRWVVGDPAFACVPEAQQRSWQD